MSRATFFRIGALVFVAGVFFACADGDLNPQPLPPSQGGTDVPSPDEGSTSSGSSGTTGTIGFGEDAGSYNPPDSGDNAGDGGDAGDAGVN